MNLYGKDPTTTDGEIFRRSEWSWNPLADFILAAAPDEAADCRNWHSDDGDGLDADAAVRLADKIDTLISDGTAARAVARADDIAEFAAFARASGGFEIC